MSAAPSDIDAGLTAATEAALTALRNGYDGDRHELSDLLGASIYILRTLKEQIDRPTLVLVVDKVEMPSSRTPAPEPEPAVASAPVAHLSTVQLLTDFQTHLLAAGLSPNTVRLRMVYLRQFAAEHDDLMNVDRGTLEAFLAERRLTMNAGSRSNIRASFRAFYSWASEEGRIASDPAARLGRIRVNTPVPRVAVDADVEAGLAKASDRHKAMILLARYGCLRREEIATLHTRHRDGTTLRVLGKGDKQRRVPINPDLMTALLKLEQTNPEGYYFPDRSGGHVTGAAVHQAIMRLTGWNAHALRHAGATAAYRATKDLEALRAMLGHATVATTQRYLHVREEDLRAVGNATAIGFEDE